MEEVDAMETSSYLDVSSATAGHTSAEGVSLDQSELNVLADDLMDTSIRASTGNSLRSSRRRVQKHSAVVLNADRLKKVIHHQSNPDDPTIADTTMLDESNLGEDISMVMQSVQSSAEEITIIPSSSTQPPGKDSSPNIKTNTTNHDSANPRTPPTTHQVGIRIWTEDKAQRHIIRWYRRQVAARLRRFTLHGKWSVTTSMKVFTLLLGYRIRRLFHSNEMKKMKLAQDDMQRVLLDLMRSSSTSPSTPRDDRSPFWLPHIRTEIIANKHLSPTDQNLAKSLVRELLAEREKFVKYVFHFATWISFPLPGYWNISGTRLKRTSSLYFSSPRTTNTTNHNKLITETPPHVKMAMSKNDSNNMKKVPVRLNLGRNPNPIIDPLADFSEIISSEGTSLLNDDQLKPKPLGDVMQDKSKIMSTPVAASQNFGEYVDDRPITPSAAYISPGGVNISSVSAAAAYKRVDISTSLSNKIKGHSQSVTSAPTSIVSDANLSKKLAQHSSKRESTSPEWKQPQSTRNRNEDGGHIQLDILSAEKLIPAKKVS